MTLPALPDEPHVNRIAEALWSRKPSGTAVVLIGAGFSRNAVPALATAGVMPGWNDMYKEMVSQLYPAADPGFAATSKWLLGQTGATSAYLRVAEEYEAQFRRDGLDKLILRHVPDLHFAPGDLHRDLLQLPWADVMTTNWDTLLERAAEGVEDRVYDVVRTVDEIPEARAPRIIKLHGSLPSHRPFVFTEEDFRTYPGRFAPFINLAQQLAMENTLVLLGFSGDDPNFLYWSGWVRDRLGPKAPLIYLVGALDLSASKRKMLEARSVQPIDLSRLPEFASWPEQLRVQNANRWFLERMRAWEPYPARRWPRPPAGFVPALELVQPRTDPKAPPPDVQLGSGTQLAKLRQLVEQSRRLRLTYPGWIVPPLDVAATIWSRLRPGLLETAPALLQLSPRERLAAMYELEWQLQVALIPFGLVFAEHVLGLLDELEPDFASLEPGEAGMFRALALSAVRHAREEGDSPLFARWADWLEPKVAHLVEERERLTYERCLQLRVNLDLAELERIVAAWVVSGDPYWNVRKAGLLADLGRDEEAAALSIRALNEIRQRTSRGTDDIASWSRESYAMLLRSVFLHGDLGSWMVQKPVRERFDERQDVLAARGCAGRQDFFRLVEGLDQVPPPLQSAIERTVRFDLGSSSVRLRFAGDGHAERRLLAYKALRHLDETGMPARIGNVTFGTQLLEKASRWLIDVDANRAVDALMRGLSKPGSDSFEAVISRSTVALTSHDDADDFVEKLLRLAEISRARVEEPGPARFFWLDRLRFAVELISRFVLRTPERAGAAMRLAVALQASSFLVGYMGIPDEIARLVARSAEPMSDEEAERELPHLFSLPVPSDPDGTRQVLDLPSALREVPGRPVRSDAWAAAADLALDAAQRPDRRFLATERLRLLRQAGMLDEDQERRFGEVLWAPDLLVDGLPGGTVFLPVAFLKLPAPGGVDVRSAVAGTLLAGGLTDDLVLERGIWSLLASDDFSLDEAELLQQITRLREFIERHPPAPAHPDIVGDRRDELVERTSAIFAELARRAAGSVAATAATGELARIDRHPLRLEPALPALVALGLVQPDDAIRKMRTLFSSNASTAPRLIEMALHCLLRTPVAIPSFEATVWNDVAAVVLGRRPGPLAPCLAVLAYALRTSPARVPASVDEQVTMGLGLILAETAPGHAPEGLAYEPFLVRYRAARLAERLRAAGRGYPEVLDAWADVADTDPLPDVRRARRSELRPD